MSKELTIKYIKWKDNIKSNHYGDERYFFETAYGPSISDIYWELKPDVILYDIFFQEIEYQLTGADLIAKERDEQINKHGLSITHDVKENRFNQLIDAASVLLSSSFIFRSNSLPPSWNKELWDKMVSKSAKERLIISGALIAAEIDRMLANGEINNNA